MSTVYLAGPIAQANYGEAQDWREYVEELFWIKAPGIRILSPMRGKEYLSRVSGPLGAKPYNENPMSTSQGVIGRDRNDVRRSDVIMMNFLGATEISAGTMMEAGWSDAWRKPIVIVREEDGNPHDHLMLNAAATYIVDNLEDAVDLIIMLLAE